MEPRIEFPETEEEREFNLQEAIDEYRKQGMEIMQVLIPVPEVMLKDKLLDLQEEIESSLGEGVRLAVRMYREKLD